MRFPREHLEPLTGLRGLAALWVVVFHTCFGEPNGYLPGFHEKINWGLGRNVVVQGVYAVDIFFVLSGYILAYVHREQFQKTLKWEQIFDFYFLRLARIYPIHLLVLVLLVGVHEVGIWNDRVFGLENIVLNSFLLNMWADPSINIPAWSVSAEWFAYLGFPFIIFFLFRVQHMFLQWLLAIGLMTIYPLGVMYFEWTWEWHFGWVALYRVFNGFILGCLMYALQEQCVELKTLSSSSRWSALLVGVFFVFLVFGLPIIFVYPLIPFLIVAVGKSKSGLSHCLSNKLIVVLGTVSFSIYMVHFPVLEIFRFVLNDVYAALDPSENLVTLWVHLVVILISIIAVATLVYTYVEKPSREYFKQKLDARERQREAYLIFR